MSDKKSSDIYREMAADEINEIIKNDDFEPIELASVLCELSTSHEIASFNDFNKCKNILRDCREIIDELSIGLVDEELKDEVKEILNRIEEVINE